MGRIRLSSKWGGFLALTSLLLTLCIFNVTAASTRLAGLDPGWVQVNTSGFGDGNNQDIWAGLAVFGDYLYVGTENGTTGAEIWRSANGADWSQVNADGFGDPNNSGLLHHDCFRQLPLRRNQQQRHRRRNVAQQ